VELGGNRGGENKEIITSINEVKKIIIRKRTHATGRIIKEDRKKIRSCCAHLVLLNSTSW
jgi:hypothetical protein